MTPPKKFLKNHCKADYPFLHSSFHQLVKFSIDNYNIFD